MDGSLQVLAVENGHLDVVQELLSRGCAVNTRCGVRHSALHTAARLEVRST
jgi:ankyrin repeat protein